jgi:hypothetical protein
VILLAVGQYVPRRSILAGEKQRNPASAAPASAKPARSSAAPKPRRIHDQPHYTGRKTGIDRDNRERVFRQAARVVVGLTRRFDCVSPPSDLPRSTDIVRPARLVRFVPTTAEALQDVIVGQ